LEIASLEYQETRDVEDKIRDLHHFLSLAVNPPQWLRMTERDTAELKVLFLNILEALNALYGCDLDPRQVQCCLMFHAGRSYRSIGRELGLHPQQVKRNCRAGITQMRLRLEAVAN